MRKRNYIIVVLILISAVVSCTCPPIENTISNYSISDISVNSYQIIEKTIDEQISFESQEIAGPISYDELRIAINHEYSYSHTESNVVLNTTNSFDLSSFSFIKMANASEPCPPEFEKSENYERSSIISITSNNDFNEIPMGENLIDVFNIVMLYSYDANRHYFSNLTLNTAPEENSNHVFTVKVETENGVIFEVFSDSIVFN